VCRFDVRPVFRAFCCVEDVGEAKKNIIFTQVELTLQLLAFIKSGIHLYCGTYLRMIMGHAAVEFELFHRNMSEINLNKRLIRNRFDRLIYKRKKL